MRGGLRRGAGVLATAAVVSSFLLGCFALDWLTQAPKPDPAESRMIAAQVAASQKAAEEKRQKALDAEQAPAASSDLAPDMSSVTGPHMLAFSGENPTPNNFALMNSTGFLSEGGKWKVQKTVTFVPAGGSSGYDRYVLDIDKAADGTLSGTIRFTRKMVMVAPDTKKDYKTLTSAWKGTVNGRLESDGTIMGKVTGSSTGSGDYIAENWPLQGPPPPPDVQPAKPISWRLTGEW